MWVVSVLFVVVIGSFLSYGAFKELNDDLQQDLSLSPEARQASKETVENFPSSMDNILFFFFIMLWVFLLIGAFVADTHPVFLVITFVLLIIGLVFGMILSNAYEEFSSDSGVSEFASQFPKMNWILGHLLIVLVFMGMSTFMVLYARNSG